MTTAARLCPATLRTDYVRQMRDMGSEVMRLRAVGEHGLADELTCYRDRRGAELRALIARADNGADA